MIAWLYPAALAGLAAIAGPILVHLLRRQSAVRVPFPSVRFIQPTRAAAVRLRRPSDLVLLAARVAIVALAAIAWARPLLVTSARVEAWSATTVRAVAVDASESMRASTASGQTVLAEAEALARREAAEGPVIADADLRMAISRALAALDARPPSRRELVVISDFQEGALSAEDLSRVPAVVGVRLVRVGAPPRDRRFAGETRIGVDSLTNVEVRLAGPTTAASHAPGRDQMSGLRLVTDGRTAADLRALVETLADAGTPEPSPSQPLAIRLGSGPSFEAEARSGSGAPAWMLETALRLRDDADLTALARDAVAGAAIGEGAPFLTLFRDRDGKPLLRLAAGRTELLLETSAGPSSLFAAAVVRGALMARGGRPSYKEQEIQTIPDDLLAKWSRPAGAITPDDGRRGGLSDARWCWAALLVALAIETAAVRRRRAVVEEVSADAA